MRSDKEILDALEYIYENKNGYFHELIDYVDEELVDIFRVMGFIHIGYTLKYRTWSITNLGKQYYKDIQ